jgi:hypothetical protein
MKNTTNFQMSDKGNLALIVLQGHAEMIDQLKLSKKNKDALVSMMLTSWNNGANYAGSDANSEERQTITWHMKEYAKRTIN